MSNGDIVKQNYGLIRLCCSHQARKYEMPQEFMDDLVQEICLIMLEYDNEKLNRIVKENHLNAWLTGVLVNQLWSVNSPFYRTYRRLRDNSGDILSAYSLDDKYEPKARYKQKKEPLENPVCVEDYNVTEDDSDFMISVKESLDRLSIGELSIFLNYAESGNVSRLARQMKVPQALLNNYITQIKRKIKDNIKEREYDD